jgi:hypothetical protein
MIIDGINSFIVGQAESGQRWRNPVWRHAE